MRRTLLELFHAMEEMQPSILLADISFFISAEGFEIPLKVSFEFCGQIYSECFNFRAKTVDSNVDFLARKFNSMMIKCCLHCYSNVKGGVFFV